MAQSSKGVSGRTRPPPASENRRRGAPDGYSALLTSDDAPKAGKLGSLSVSAEELPGAPWLLLRMAHRPAAPEEAARNSLPTS